MGKINLNIIFLTVSNIETLDKRGIYPDLMRKFRDEGHHMYIVSPTERRHGKSTYLINEKNTTILKVKTLNVQKTNVVEKGIATLLLNGHYVRAIKNNLKGVKFDLVIYSTPPITLTSAIAKLKKKQKAKTYLLLKDIFPQNAIDIGLMKKDLLYKYFRMKEKRLYKISDYIGCMSPANVEYLLKHDPDIDKNKIEVNPNSIEPLKETGCIEDKILKRNKYGIPLYSTVFLYGGNLGKPQGIDFLLEVLKDNINKNEVFFLIVGTGTEYKKIHKWFAQQQPSNAKLINGLLKSEYDILVSSCDVGLIFLDKRFTIPNYPSRLLSYLENSLPIIAATDVYSDIGKIAEKNGYGFWCENGDIKKMQYFMDKLCNNKLLRKKMGEQGNKFMIENYTVEKSYKIIMKHFN